MESVPNGNVEVVSVAVLLRPLAGVSVALPMAVEPSIKVTEPVGAAWPLETVAVRVTDWPKLEGVSEEATVAVVPAGFTTWVVADEVAPPKSAVAA
jgi:hypothetical protein